MPLAILELLERVYQMMARYFGALSEECLRGNFSTLYLLLDEMIDHGVASTTEPNILEVRKYVKVV